MIYKKGKLRDYSGDISTVGGNKSVYVSVSLLLALIR